MGCKDTKNEIPHGYIAVSFTKSLEQLKLRIRVSNVRNINISQINIAMKPQVLHKVTS